MRLGGGLPSAGGGGGGGPATSFQVECINGNAAPITRCQPVYQTAAANTVDLAQADAAATCYVLGLVADAEIDPGDTGAVQLAGPMEATTDEWDAVTGDTGGLIPGSRYWVSATVSGGLTRIPPSRHCRVVRAGRALSPTQLIVHIDFMGTKS